MKNKHKGLKIFGAIAGITAICCIVPACVVSCGSSSNSSTSNQPTLPSSLYGTSASEVASNWNDTYNAYAGSSNYGN
ncbi:hypothetical protein J6W20_00495 [bacterium]|nr:hypothetical protein [bacterium]